MHNKISNTGDGRMNDSRFTYHIINEGIRESLTGVSSEYFLFAEFLFRLMEYPYQVAISNDQDAQYLVYGEDESFF